MLFESFQDLLRILVSAIISYAVIIVWLRVAGKRTLSKWNAFDYIVTIALGSILASMILSKDVKMADGILAFSLLMLFQFSITFLSSRFSVFDKIIKAEPKFLYCDNRFLEQNMKAERVPKPEILAAIRSAGISALDDVRAVILETDGSFSVVKKSDDRSDSALSDVQGRENFN